jgi:hypothetical protein
MRSGEAPASGDGPSSLVTVVVLILAVATSYLLTRFVIGRLQRRFVFVTGAEFVLLGVALGRALPDIGTVSNLSSIAPIIALAAGWVGLIAGMQLDLFHAREGNRGGTALALFLAFGSGGAVGAAAYVFFGSGMLPNIGPDEAMIGAGFLACAAAAGSTNAIDLLRERYQLEKGLAPFLRRVSELGDILAITVFGVLFCIFHQGEASVPMSPAAWLGVSLGVGVLLGLVFGVFIVEDESEQTRFLALVGIIAFASGAAYFLRISPLFVNLLLGIVLVSTEKGGHAILKTLEGTARPMRLILLVFAGALWVPPPAVPALLAIGGYVVLRVFGRLSSAWVASIGLATRGDLGRGLLAQGDVALAMALSFRLVYEGTAIDVAYTVVLASIVLHEMLAPRVLRNLLIDAGEVRREVGASS